MDTNIVHWSDGSEVLCAYCNGTIINDGDDLKWSFSKGAFICKSCHDKPVKDGGDNDHMLVRFVVGTDT